MSRDPRYDIALEPLRIVELAAKTRCVDDHRSIEAVRAMPSPDAAARHSMDWLKETVCSFHGRRQLNNFGF